MGDYISHIVLISMGNVISIPDGHNIIDLLLIALHLYLSP